MRQNSDFIDITSELERVSNFVYSICYYKYVHNTFSTLPAYCLNHHTKLLPSCCTPNPQKPSQIIIPIHCRTPATHQITTSRVLYSL